MYDLLLSDGSEKKTLKGLSKNVVKNEISIQNYQEVLETGIPQRHEMRVIRSKNHQLYIQELTKTSLSSWDDKRFAMDSISTLPYGHILTIQSEQSN